MFLSLPRDDNASDKDSSTDYVDKDPFEYDDEEVQNFDTRENETVPKPYKIARAFSLKFSQGDRIRTDDALLSSPPALASESTEDRPHHDHMSCKHTLRPVGLNEKQIFPFRVNVAALQAGDLNPQYLPSPNPFSEPPSDDEGVIDPRYSPWTEAEADPPGGHSLSHRTELPHAPETRETRFIAYDPSLPRQPRHSGIKTVGKKKCGFSCDRCRGMRKRCDTPTGALQCQECAHMGARCTWEEARRKISRPRKRGASRVMDEECPGMPARPS